MSAQQWYVHILGPDDIEGPFPDLNAAIQYAMGVNIGIWVGRAATEFSPATWAVPTTNPKGVTA